MSELDPEKKINEVVCVRFADRHRKKKLKRDVVERKFYEFFYKLEISRRPELIAPYNEQGPAC